MDSLPEEIVLNRMFVGNYLENNLGHEVINLYQADFDEENGEQSFYTYLQADGKFDEKRHNVRYMLMVKYVEQNKLEIISKAKIIKAVCNDDPIIDKVKYGGVKLKEIFAENIQQQNTVITFKVESIITPKEPLYIIFKDSNNNVKQDESHRYCLLTQNAQATTSLRQYVNKYTTPEDYDHLETIIENDDLWGECVKTVKETSKEYNNDALAETFFSICGIQHYELAFSNALVFFIKKYPELLVEFATSCLCKKDFSLNNLKVKREWNNIDILITTSQNIIIIENKIKSGINGVEKDKKGKVIYSQLDKYLSEVEQLNKDNKKSICPFIICPDYNVPVINSGQRQRQYEIIRYSKIYNYLKAKLKTDSTYSQDLYFNDFVKALYPHTKNIVDFSEETRALFLKRINNIKRKQILNTLK